MKKKAFIPISALVGALLLAIIATMTPFIAERNLAYAQTNSDIATLSNLRVNPGTLAPAFDPADLPSDGGNDGTSVTNAHPYTVNVRHSVNSLTVSATKTDRNASVAYIVNGGTPGNSGRISLAIGNANVVVVRVTAEDATTQKFYEVTVTRASSTASGDATLSALSVSPGTLSPAFMAATTEYSVDLPYDPNTNADVDLTVTASESDSVVTVKKDGDVVALQDIPIDEGDNTITVDVLAPNFVATETYTLTINRARRNASDDATLSLLDLNQGMLMPAFDSANLPDGNGNNGTSAANAHPYTVSVPHSVIEVTVTAATTDSRAKWEVTAPADNDSTQRGHQVSLTTSPTTEIMIMATAEDRTTEKFYEVTVTRAAVGASTDATLSALSVSPGTLSPAFMAATTEYSVDLPYDTNADVDLTVTASESDSVVTVKKDGDVVALQDIPIDEGDNTITVDVLAPNFVATETYTLTINRASANASDDDRLSLLDLSEGMLMPAFDSADLPDGDGTAGTPHLYTARVANSVESLTVTGQAESSVAMVSITSAQDSSVSEGAVDLIVGDNVITIAVTAEDRGAAKVYQVTVTRASSTASNNATLSALSVSPGTLSPAFMAATTEYSVDLPYDPANNAAVDLTVTASESTSVVTVKKGNEIIAAVDLDTIAIDEGDNTITVDVLAPDFVATKTYTLTINRASANASDDDSLSLLDLSEGMLMPAFDSADLPDGDGTAGTPHLYTARVANSVESLTVTGQAESSVAMVSITSAQDSSVSEGAVDLIVGDNVITIAVTAEDRGAAKVYQVTVTRVAASASSNAALGGLTLTTGAVVDPSLNPAFDAASLPALTGGAHHFTASVSRGTDMVQVIPVAGDVDGAVVNVMSDADDTVTMVDTSDPPAYAVDLEVGDNVITVMVTAANVVTTKTYKITINRPGTGNATLSDLSLSGVSLNEAFGTAADDAYTADVASSVSTTVMATAVQSNATVSIMPVDADSAMDGHQVALTPDSNTIVVTVTAGDNTRVYTVTVTVPSSDATLRTLALSGITLSPAFDPAMTEYTAEVLNTVEATTVEAMATHPDATVEGTGDESLTLGENTVEVMVTAEDGTTTMTYTVTVTVTAPSSDATLQMLALSGITLSPDFDSATMEYTATVDATVQATTVSAMATHPSATIEVTGDESLTVGENTVEVMVTAEDGTTMMTYTVTVTVLSSDATLASLTLSDITLSPEFDSAITEYTATVAYVESTTVEATPTHSGAMVDGTGEMSLMVGENTVEVMVTAEDGTTTMTYTITVTVEMPTLLDRYDADDSRDIDLTEVNNAIDDFFDGELTLAEVNAVIDLFFQ